MFISICLRSCHILTISSQVTACVFLYNVWVSAHDFEIPWVQEQSMCPCELQSLPEFLDLSRYCSRGKEIQKKAKGKAVPLQAWRDLDRPRGFQEVKVPRFRDNGTGWW